MSNVNSARRAETQVIFDGIDISVYVNSDLISLTYTDNEEDEADDLQIKVLDRDGNWLKKWLNTVVSDAAEGGNIISEAPTSDISRSGSTDETENSGKGKSDSTYKVTATSGVNVRNTASESGKLLGKLPYGTVVAVSKFLGSWARIIYSGKTAYIKGSNLKPLGETDNTQSTKGGTANSGGGGANSGDKTASKGLKVSAMIVRKNWNGDGKDEVLDCGEFELDSIEADGPPSAVTAKCTSLPYSCSIRQTLKSRSWENTTLKSIAQEIAKQNYMTVMFESSYNPQYTRVEQYHMSDIAFLQKLCHDMGASLKVTNKILVIFDQSAYEKNKAVRTVKFGETGGYTKYRLSTNTNGSYTSCRVCCTASDGSIISATEYAENYREDNGGKNQCLEVRQRVSNTAEAQLLAHKMLRLHNKFEFTASFTFPGDPSLLAGNVIELSDFGAWDGKYIIKQAVHSLSRSGFTTNVTLRKALKENEIVVSVPTEDNEAEIDELARQCIRGDWGNGQERFDRLTAAGHSYRKVQDRVNEILYG